MKNIFYTFCFLLALGLTSCVTGNDDNAVLSELEEQYAKTPRVENLMVDGVEPSRDQVSHWIDFEVEPGQQINITAMLDAGVGAASANFNFYRTYYSTSYDIDDGKAVEPMTDDLIAVSAGVTEFNFTYTVPTLDDEGYQFIPGDHINLTWNSSNDLGGQGFNDINLIYK